MGFLKTPEEKEREMQEKIKKNWNKTSEDTLGISYEECRQIIKKFEEGLIDAKQDDGRISDSDVINALFSNLSPEQKGLILYYGRWVNIANLKEGKI